jgi:hypothetical protein
MRGICVIVFIDGLSGCRTARNMTEKATTKSIKMVRVKYKFNTKKQPPAKHTIQILGGKIQETHNVLT